MGNDLKLRRWRDEDCLLLHAWRQHPVNRRWFGNQSEVPLGEHQAWFAGFMADYRRFGFILEVDAAPVAQIRFDPAELPGSYRISLAVAPDKKGLGYGAGILNLACSDPDLCEMAGLFIAETMTENLPSQRTFLRHGFVTAGSTSRAGSAMLCWLLPSASAKKLPPLPLRLTGKAGLCDRLVEVLAATGLADVSDQGAVNVILGGICELDGFLSPFLHLNIENGAVLLDLARGMPIDNLALPLEFENIEVAVAQIVTFVRQQLELRDDSR